METAKSEFRLASSCLRRALAGAVAAALIVVSPGLECYRACAATIGELPTVSRRSAGVPTLPEANVPSLSLPVQPLSVGVDADVAVIAAAPIAAEAAAPQALASAQPISAAALAQRPEMVSVALGAQTVQEAAQELARPDLSAESAHDVGARLAGERAVSGPAAFGAAVPAMVAQVRSSPRQKQALSLPARFLYRAKSAARATALAAVLSLSVGFAPGVALSQGIAPAPAPAQQQAPVPAPGPGLSIIPAPTPAQEAVKQIGPVSAKIEIQAAGATVGDRFPLVLILTNSSDKPVALSGLRNSLNDALPEDVELQPNSGADTVVLAPGQTQTIAYETIAFASGDIAFGGPLILNAEEGGKPVEGAQAVLADGAVQIKSVLTPDWKQIGFKDIAGVERPGVPLWAWLAALPLLAALLFGAERVLSAQRRGVRKLAVSQSLLAATRRRLSDLASTQADAKAFYGELFAVLSDFLVDSTGLPVKARDAKTLIADLKNVKGLSSGQLKVAGDLALRAEAFRFGADEAAPSQRQADLKTLSDLVESLAAAKSKGGQGFFGLGAGATQLQFGAPWALLLLIPLAGYLAWQFWRRKAEAKKSAFALPSLSTVAPRKSLSERLTWLPKSLRALALTFLLIGIADPRLGVSRQESITPSTDTMLVLDVSGSMSDSFRTGSGGGGPTKLSAAEDAMKGYINEQRRGTSNRVGLVTFSDDPYLDVHLTTDYDALIAHLKELKTLSSTAIGKAILTATGQFLEANAMELDDQADPRVAEVKTLIRTRGLGAALDYAKPFADLMEKIVRPDRKKVVVLFTDGESNSGIEPIPASDIAKKLGVRVYTVGIAPKGGSVSGYDEKTLVSVARNTGAQFYRADDAERMRDILLEISRLEKSPTKIVSAVSVKSVPFGEAAWKFWFALALASLLLELGLSNTRFRVLSGLLIMTLPLAAPLVAPYSPAQAVQPVVETAAVDQSLPVYGVPQEIAAANLLYNEGRYEEALKSYARALERYPDRPELYYNLGNAYLRLGEVERAKINYGKFLSLTKDPVLASRAIYNMGNAALMQKDVEGAVENYKEALRRDSHNERAKWNLEVIKKLQEEQQKNQQQQNQNSKQKQKGKQKGQKGNQQGNQQGDQKGDQQGDQKGDRKGNQQGQPGNPKGEAQAKPGDKQKSGTDALAEKLGEQEKQAQEGARKAIPRKGDHAWGLLGLPILGASGTTALAFGSAGVMWAAAILLPIAAGLIAYGIHKKLESAKKLSPATAPKSFSGWSGKAVFLRKSAAVLLAAGLLGIAASGPKSGYKDERVNFGGKDIMVTLDNSLSMIYAEDGREERTRKELTDFISRLQGTDRVGLVVFAGSARTAAPLSMDYGNFEYKLDRLEVESRGLKDGTDLAEAVRFAAESYETAKSLEGRQRVMIVISDGDIFGEELEKAVKTAQEHHITIYAIGVGTPAGAKIKIPTEDGKGTEYLLDEKTGQPAVSALNEEPLRQLSARTGGAYFRAGPEASMTRIMEQVAQMQKGEKGDTIKSPRGAAEWFAWPALLLLLLDLLVPAGSVLRNNKDKARGLALLGAAAALPLSSWVLMLPFAALFAALVAVIAADVFSGGALRRKAAWALERRRKVVENGLAADAGALFDLREVDAPKLSAYSQAYAKADDLARGALAAEASTDPQLWRQKLLTAFLHGGAPERQEALLSALVEGQKRHLEPVEPVVLELLARRESLPWLGHVDAARRLARLAQAFVASDEPAYKSLAAFPDTEVRRALGTAIPARRAWNWRRALSAGLAGLMLASSFSWAGFSGYKTAQYFSERQRAVDFSLRAFYREDMFVFADRYADERIPEKALPALKRWQEEPRGAAGDLEVALKILSESPDPKADNVLEVILKHADILPLSSKSEYALLHTLVIRENDDVWRFMEQQLQASAGNPRMTLLMQKMIAIAAAEGSEKTFQNIFHFLKSPNETIQKQAAFTIYRSLTAEDQAAKFFDRLSDIQARYADDASLNLWVEQFLLERLSTAQAKEIDGGKARGLLEKLLDAGASTAAARAQAIAAAVSQPAAGTAAGSSQAANSGPQIPPAYLEAALGMMLQAEQAFAEEGKPVPPVLAELVKYGVNRTTTQLIKEGEGKFPGLHQKLVAAGVVLSDTESSYSGYDDYEGYEYGYHGRGGGYTSTTQNYRELYKLAHLSDFAKVLIEAAQAADPAALKPETLEYLDRAAKALEAMRQLGPLSGMLGGGTAGEKAADEVNKVLDQGASKLNAKGFLAALRAKNLAPNNGVDAGAARFFETYTFQNLEDLRVLLESVASSGQGWDYSGNPKALTLAEKQYLASALDGLDALERRFFPDQAKPESKAKATADLWKSIERPGEQNLALARLSVALAANDKDVALQLQGLKYLVAHSAKDANPDELAEVIAQIGKAAGNNGQKAVIAELARALEGRPNDDPLALAVRKEIQRQAVALMGEATSAFGGLGQKLVDRGVKASQYSDRGQYKLIHLRRFLVAVAEEQAGLDPKTESDAAKRAAARVRQLGPALIALAAKAGISPGDTPADLVAEAVNRTLHDGWSLFDGQTFLEALRREGLEPKGSSTDIEQGYYQQYSKESLEKILKFLRDVKASGNGWNSSDMAPKPLKDKEVEYLDKAIKDIKAQIDHYGELAPGAEKEKAHGLALLGLAALPWLGNAILIGAALVAAYFAVRYAMRKSRAAAAAARERDPSAALARYRKIELAASRLANAVAGGSFRSVFIGSGGTDFAEAKPYNGEDLRDIDWKTSAKQGELYAKKYELEKDMPLMLLVDLSRSADFGTRGASKREVIEDAAAVLALAGAAGNLRVGAMIVTDKVEAYIPPQSGTAHAREIARRLADFQPSGEGTDLRPGISLAMKELRARAMVAVVSDFIAEGFNNGLSALSQRHDLRLIRVSDPAELAPLPSAGLVLVKDAETGQTRLVDTSNSQFRADHAALLARQESARQAAFSAARARPVTLSTEGDPLETLITAFSPKRKAQ